VVQFVQLQILTLVFGFIARVSICVSPSHLITAFLMYCQALFAPCPLDKAAVLVRRLLPDFRPHYNQALLRIVAKAPSGVGPARLAGKSMSSSMNKISCAALVSC
jgi:hypothetical protein